LSFFKNASETFYGTASSPGLFAAQQHLQDSSPTSDFSPAGAQNPLYTKQAIIVLREELEYFSIPPKGDTTMATDQNGIANLPLVELKRKGGQYLMEKKSIFTALQRNVNRENNIAEQHLIDMLCMRYVRTFFGCVFLCLRCSRSALFIAGLIVTTNGVSVH
jgi:hypothetical protein